MDGINSVIIGGLLTAIVFALAGLRWVPEGHTYTISRRGQFHRSLGPGLHFVVPLLDRITHRVNMLGRVLGVHCDCMATKDAHQMEADGLIYFQVLDPRKVAGRLPTLDEAAQNLTETTTAEMLKQLTANALHDRTGPELNQWLLGLMNQSASQWGVRITRIELDFSDLDDAESRTKD